LIRSACDKSALPLIAAKLLHAFEHHSIGSAEC
jgi:hypothetical protein